MKFETSITKHQGDISNQKTTFAQSNGTVPKQLCYKAISEHLCCDLNGETVILSLANGKYYGINSVGSRIWELLENFITLPEIEKVILSEYAVAEEICRQEVTAFLELMIAEGLVETRYESSAAISKIAVR